MINLNMKKSSILAVFFAFFFLSSCDKSDIDLVDKEFKNFELISGGDLEIPIISQNWKVSGVKDSDTGLDILDKSNNKIVLNGEGAVETENGWLIIERENDNALIIRMKENFDIEKRNIIIYLESNGNKDQIKISQSRGESYKLVNAEFEELQDERIIYTNTDGCGSMVLTNNSLESEWKPYGEIYKDVVYSSTFESDNVDAFKWTLDEDAYISVPDLVIDGYTRWSNTCLYKKGLVATPYINDIEKSDKILLEPNQTVYLKSEMTYCKRICNYKFIIENETSGVRFEEKGVWTQIIPISSHTTSSDKEL